MLGRRGVVAVAAALVAMAVGCGAGDGVGTNTDDATESHGEPGAGSDAPSAVTLGALRERPWEVVSNKGETYLADVFYAEPGQNEQIMPWVIDGKPAIDRLVYPTLGNPNLYVKDDASDQLVTVLRIEDDAIAHLAPKTGPADGEAPRELTLTSDDANGVAFFLVARSARARATRSEGAVAPGDGVYRVAPTKVLVNAEPKDMPASLAERHTIRFVFDQAAMKDVPPGLYDVRFEVKKGGAVYANVWESQFNAVRVFDHASDEYTALNVTDTQVSVGGEYTSLTAAKIDDFVDAVNGSTDETVTKAAFITFNGDLHNGGSPGTLRARSVATTYANEAKRILGALQRLNLPIFLTPGNHDGYAATGQMPSAVVSADKLLGDSLQKVVGDQNDVAWPGFQWSDYAAYLAKTTDVLGGLHRDLVTGAFTRKVGDTFGSAYQEIPRADRNMVLYDGFYQWQKTYGPLYASWTFGKNRFVSMNTYELRQHRRTGWGMYTVNYGGSVGKVQLAWLDRELSRAEIASEDVVVLMHHDPRGGHKGKDFGYYFPVLDYQGIGQSTINYLLNEKFTPAVCKLPDASLSVDDRDSCLHDGLQEWMAPDPEMDQGAGGLFNAGVELLTRLAKSPNVRTLLIGHAHLNSLEVLQQGDTLVPNRLTLDAGGDAKQTQRLAWLEEANPVRRLAWEQAVAPVDRASVEAVGDHDVALLPGAFASHRASLEASLARAAAGERRVMSSPDGGPRELAILRLTSNADLSSEKYDGQSAYGWSVLHVTKQSGAVPRVNRVTYMIHGKTAGASFDEIDTVDVDRNKSMGAKDANNPVAQLFTW